MTSMFQHALRKHRWRHNSIFRNRNYTPVKSIPPPGYLVPALPFQRISPSVTPTRVPFNLVSPSRWRGTSEGTICLLQAHQLNFLIYFPIIDWVLSLRLQLASPNFSAQDVAMATSVSKTGLKNNNNQLNLALCQHVTVLRRNGALEIKL